MFYFFSSVPLKYAATAIKRETGTCTLDNVSEKNDLCTTTRPVVWPHRGRLLSWTGVLAALESCGWPATQHLFHLLGLSPANRTALVEQFFGGVKNLLDFYCFFSIVFPVPDVTLDSTLLKHKKNMFILLIKKATQTYQQQCVSKYALWYIWGRQDRWL